MSSDDTRGQQYSGQNRPRGPINGLAVASLVLSLLWFYGLASILAIVLGIVAKWQIRARNQSGSLLANMGILFGGLGFAGLVYIVVVLTRGEGQMSF